MFLLTYDFLFQLNISLPGVLLVDFFKYFHNALETINHQLHPNPKSTLYDLEVELFVQGQFFYEEGDPTGIFDDYQDEVSEEAPEIPLLSLYEIK
ncbi:hypothetical protein HMI55_005163 [Coelomomyces lativittatus]|nr:hypothetical protein HMI55_005163 [Coelomomyces lativittatus]